MLITPKDDLLALFFVGMSINSIHFYDDLMASYLLKLMELNAYVFFLKLGFKTLERLPMKGRRDAIEQLNINCICNLEFLYV